MRRAGADELDRPPCKLDRARRRTDIAGESGCPGAELDEVEAGERGRVRNGVPDGERPLEMPVRLREPEDRRRLARRLDRGMSASAARPAADQCGASSAEDAAPVRASSSARRACSSSRSPGRIVA